jgi:hypothetical protein
MLVKHATWRILVNLIWIGLVFAGRSLAASYEPDASDDLTAPLVPIAQSESEFTDLEIIETPPPESLLDGGLGMDSAVCLDGGTFGTCVVPPYCANCGGGTCCPPTWYWANGVRVLTRSKPRSIFITIDGTLNAIVMQNRQASFDIAAGYTTTVGRYLGRDAENRDQFLEFTYWGSNDWTGSREIHGNRTTYTDADGNPLERAGSLFSLFPTSVGGFNRADSHRIAYEADTNNFELNFRLRPRGRPDRMVLYPNGTWRRECQPGHYLSYLFGVRVMSIDEGFTFASEGVIESVDDDGDPVDTLGEVTGDYDIVSRNDLIGLQIGADLIQRKCKWSWGIRAKIGPFVNFAGQNSQAIADAPESVDEFATTPLDFYRRADHNGAALVGEFGFIGSYKVKPNLALVAAYDFMWVSGLALAAEQLIFEADPPARVNTNGHLYYHGVTLAVEAVW